VHTLLLQPRGRPVAAGSEAAARRTCKISTCRSKTPARRRPTVRPDRPNQFRRDRADRGARPGADYGGGPEI